MSVSDVDEDCKTIGKHGQYRGGNEQSELPQETASAGGIPQPPRQAEEEKGRRILTSWALTTAAAAAREIASKECIFVEDERREEGVDWLLTTRLDREVR